MATKKQVTCDQCGGNKNSEGRGERSAWLRLENPDLLLETPNLVRLSEPHDFCSLACLRTWATAAVPAADTLVDSADSVSPRGTFINERLGLLV